MEKEKNETEPERKSDRSLKGTVVAFIILLILAIAAFLCEKVGNAIFTILMVIISVITFFGTVILAIFSDVYLPDFAVFLEKDHFSLYVFYILCIMNSKIAIRSEIMDATDERNVTTHMTNSVF